ncbi:MAG: carboxymuconolactone decarboxylase family protein [Acidimicrobiales bacterium]|nr:carboxymuconolactone decarboxylase family protein [Acidimicrobiales bacterium]
MASRIPPLSPKEWPKAMKAALAALTPAHPRHPLPERRDDRPKGLNILGTLAHHPELATAYHTFNGHVLFGSTLDLRTREVLVLRVAAVRGCEYEWLQHAVMAIDLGLTPSEIERIGEGPDAEELAPLDAALVRAVDELLADAEIGDATWTALAAELDQRQLMDLVFTVGAYDALAMAMQSFGIEIDDDLAAHADSVPPLP